MTGPALFLSGPEFEMFERSRRGKDFTSLITKRQTAERDIEYQDISRQENFHQS